MLTCVPFQFILVYLLTMQLLLVICKLIYILDLREKIPSSQLIVLFSISIHSIVKELILMQSLCFCARIQFYLVQSTGPYLKSVYYAHFPSTTVNYLLKWPLPFLHSYLKYVCSVQSPLTGSHHP
jgi:hypothetical protein